MRVHIGRRRYLLDRRWPELVLTLMVVAGFANTVHRFIVDGKLPQPFIFDVNDTFMDWFNTAYWAHNPGAFDVWRTVYPPFSFVFLELTGKAGCYGANGIVARSCDYVSVIIIITSYIVGTFFAWKSFRYHNAPTSICRTVAFAVGLPWLFTLERGNLILPCFAAFAIANGGFVKSAILKAASTAITINFKPYLLLPALSLAWKRRWRALEATGFTTLGIYALSYSAYGAGGFIELAANTANWVQFTGGFIYEQIYYSTSYTPFLAFDTPNFPTRDFIPDQVVSAMMVSIPIVVRTSQFVVLLALAGAWLQPKALTQTRIALLLLCGSLVAQSPGGYTEVFVIFLLFLERWDSRGSIVALVAGYILSVPYDYVLSNIISLDADSWLSGRPVEARFGVAIGTFLRPGLIVVILWALALDSLALIVRAHRERRPTLDPHPRALRQGDVAA